ncbi:MAG: HAMP domain-containing protein, partial [Proteobacteria bacterium]|nr:HAMP domain-containing protein [Pseudomonadota bacterium]
MLERFSILGRLAIGFSTLLGLLVACAAVGVLALNLMYGTASRAVANDVQLAQRAGNVERLVLDERRFEKDAFINLADADALVAYRRKWEETATALEAALASVRRLSLVDADRQAMAQIAEGFGTYRRGFEQVFGRIRSGQVRTTQDANREMTEFKAAVHGMEGAAEALNRAAMSRVDGVTAELAATRASASWLQLSIALLCLGVGATLCLLITRSITRPLGRATQVARSIAAGRLDNDIGVGGHDETSQVLSALKSMQAALLENELNAKGQISAIHKAQAVVEYGLDGTVRAANANFLALFG